MKRILKAFFYSLDGLKSAFSSEPAFRQEVYLSVVIIAALFYLDTTNIEKLFVISALCIVLIAELANTAIEAICDRITKDKDPSIKKAKDVGSAAVFVALVNLVAVLAVTFVF